MTLKELYEAKRNAYAKWRDVMDTAEKEGRALTAEDRMRRGVIEALMCQMRLAEADFAATDAQEEAKTAIRATIRDMVDETRRGWVKRDGDTLLVTEAGRPFLRLIASRFDAYLGQSAGRHSVAV